MIITQRIKKLLRSLSDPKGRRNGQLFIAEGSKCVRDTLPHFKLCYLAALPEWIEEHAQELPGYEFHLMEVSRADLREISSLATAPPVVAAYRLPESADATYEDCMNGLVVALDRVQDPGNLGTILRTCDWMGVSTVIASRDTVDVFNPKTVQATMGAISRVRVCYTDLDDFFSGLPDGIPVYGTFLDGENIYTVTLSATGIIVMGNEGSGISGHVARRVTHRLLIPSFPPGQPTSESLNVATATAIALAEFRSRQLKKLN